MFEDILNFNINILQGVFNRWKEKLRKLYRCWGWNLWDIVPIAFAPFETIVCSCILFTLFFKRVHIRTFNESITNKQSDSLFPPHPTGEFRFYLHVFLWDGHWDIFKQFGKSFTVTCFTQSSLKRVRTQRRSYLSLIVKLTNPNNHTCSKRRC